MGRVREEKRRRKRIKEETIRRKKIQVREKVRVAKRCVFPMVRGSGGSKSRLGKSNRREEKKKEDQRRDRQKNEDPGA